MLNSSRIIKRRLIQLLLFIATFIAATISGGEWRFGQFLAYPRTVSFAEIFSEGLNFSIPFLLALTVHEFGHYFTARFNRLDVSLPYYIPLYFYVMPSIGTMGAFIRIREKIKSRRVIFDVGLAGPLAGFAVAIGVLYYGFANLPPASYVYEIHPDYHIWGENYEVVYSLDTVIYKKDLGHLDPAILEKLPDEIHYRSEGIFKLGSNLIFEFFKKYVADPERVPNPYEIIHYPWLFAGFLALFFTAINLIPIGQLDGGHVLFGLIGYKNHKTVSSALFIGFVFYTGLGLVTFQDMNDELFLGLPAYLSKPGLYTLYLYMAFYSLSSQPMVRLIAALSVFLAQLLLALTIPGISGNEVWLLFALIIGRFLGIHHPPVVENKPLDWKRKVLGWIAVIVFVLSFSPKVFTV